MKKIGKHIPGLIVMLVVLATAVVFAGMLLNMKVIPTKFIAVISLVMLILVLIVGALVWNTDKKIRFVLGVLIAAILGAAFILGSMYVYQTHSALADISGVNTEVTEVVIYVRADDSADSIAATADYVYGVLTDLDRENSDKAIQEVDSEAGKSVKVQEFAGLTELVDGLLNGQTGAIVLNSAYLSVIEEMDGYSDVSSRIRELTVKKVETTIEPQQTEQKSEDSADKGTVYTIFISGIDSRSGLVAKSRSDSNIVATVNTDTRQVLLVSTPRDYFVPLSILSIYADMCLTFVLSIKSNVSSNDASVCFGVPIIKSRLMFSMPAFFAPSIAATTSFLPAALPSANRSLSTALCIPRLILFIPDFAYALKSS